MSSIPNSRNFCGGGFPGWLEVYLTDVCNGKCAWCVDKNGWHPKYHATWQDIARAAIGSGKQNIILLGGEPTLYPNLREVITCLHAAGKRAWLTTNGSRLSKDYVEHHLKGLYGINISVHHYDLKKNQEITGLLLDPLVLREALSVLREWGCAVRFNCNCIRGMIDSREKIRRYIRFARKVGADKIRFAELKDDEADFVDLAFLLHHKYGLNDNPFSEGCNSNAVIDGMAVNFRQMCGLLTGCRPCPVDPQQEIKIVLYYNGKFYKGWQMAKKKNKKDESLSDILKALSQGKISQRKALNAIKRLAPGPIRYADGGGGGCAY